MSWTLSCLLLKRYYTHVELFADSVSAKFLIDQLRLPYSKVICCLDILNTYHPNLWGLAKIYTYGQQKEAFLHVDNDVFIWKPFDLYIENGELVAQSLEKANLLYKSIICSMTSELKYIPEVMRSLKSDEPAYCYNAGVLGGNNVEFFEKYCFQAFEIVNRNIQSLSKVNINDLNIFFEQFLFHCLAKQENKTVRVLLEGISDDGLYKGFGDFTEVPHKRHYLHLMGSYKRYNIVCFELANRLRLEYPEYYYRIIELYKNANLPLCRDYYNFIDFNTSHDLFKRCVVLKDLYLNNKLQKNSSIYT